MKQRGMDSGQFVFNIELIKNHLSFKEGLP